MKSKSLIWDSFFFTVVLALGMLFMLDRTVDKDFGRGPAVASEINMAKAFPVNNEPQEIIKVSISGGHLPSPPHVEVSRETLCLFTILFIDREERFENNRPKIALPPAKLLFTLFRTVISPNAP